MVSLLSFYMMGLGPTSTWGKLHLVSTAKLILTMISIRPHSVFKTVSIGNRFLWLYFNCFKSSWFHCIIIESGIFLWWVLRGDEVCMFLKKGVKKRGRLIHLSVLCLSNKVYRFDKSIRSFIQASRDQDPDRPF